MKELEYYTETLDAIKSLGESFLTENSLLSEKERKELEETYNQFLLEESSIREDIEKARKYNEEIQNYQKEDLKELSKQKNLKEIIEILNYYINEKYINYPELANHYTNLLNQINHTINLEPLINNISKIKNPSKLIQASQTSYESEMKKLTKKLKENKFTFYDPRVLFNILSNELNEEDTKLFLYSFSRFINSQGKFYINNNSLFISQLIKNLTLLNNNDFYYKKDLLNSIKKYNEKIKG